MPETPETGERPVWAGPKTRLVAVTEDLVSRQEFRVWYDVAAAASPRRLRLSRRRPRPFLLEDVGTGVLLKEFRIWSEVVAWQAQNVIAEGWKVRHLPQEERERIGLPLDDHPPVLQPQS